jgi:CRISPR-associated endonuclease Csy4
VKKTVKKKAKKVLKVARNDTMKYYRDITLLPSADIALNFLWEKVFQQIHLGFVEMKDSNGNVPVGISLPEYCSDYGPLGRKLRLFAVSKEVFTAFDADTRLKRLADYVHLTGVRDVPENIRNFSRFKRQQPKTNVERFARRRAKRKGISIEQAMSELTNFKDKQVETPFINMQSLSRKERFRLFILKEVCDTPAYEGFSTYGLSPVSTVPDF